MEEQVTYIYYSSLGLKLLYNSTVHLCCALAGRVARSVQTVGAPDIYIYNYYYICTIICLRYFIKYIDIDTKAIKYTARWTDIKNKKV